MWAASSSSASSRRLMRRRCISLASAPMNIDLANRSAIVTGGSKGLGFAIASRFAASGADVLIAARGQEALDAAVKAIDAVAKGRVVGVSADVGTVPGIRTIYDAAMRAFGKVDIVVNNAGTSRN